MQPQPLGLIAISCSLLCLNVIAAAVPAPDTSLETLTLDDDTLTKVFDPQNELGIDIIPEEISIIPKFHYDQQLGSSQAYSAALSALLQLALSDPRGMIGPKSFVWGSVVVDVGGMEGIKPIPTLIAAFGIYETISELSERNTFVGCEMVIYWGVHAMGKVTFKLDTIIQVAAIGENAVEEPVMLEKGKGANYVVSSWEHVWSGERISDEDFYLSLSILAVKMARVPIEAKKRPFNSFGATHDWPAFPILIVDLTETIIELKFLSCEQAVEMMRKAWEYGKEKAEGKKEGLTVTEESKDELGLVHARWRLTIEGRPPAQGSVETE